MEFIYTISCPETGFVVYVGKTMDIHSRRASHISAKNKTRLSDWVNQIKLLGLLPIIEVIDTVPTSEVCYWEQFYIDLMKLWGFDLLNMKTAKKVRNHKNHTILAIIYRMKITFKEFCDICNLNYIELQNCLTMSSLTLNQSLIIQNNLSYAKNHPTVRERKKDQSAKRKAKQKVANSKIAGLR